MPTTASLTNPLLDGWLGLRAKLAFIPQLSLSMGYALDWKLVRTTTTTTDVPVYGGTSGGGTDTVSVTDSSSRQGGPYATFDVTLTYLIADWINVSLSYGSAGNSAVDPSGHVYNPFYNPYSQLTLSAVLYTDRIYLGLAN